jgi:predicted dienelactone hydrolase
MSNLRLVIFSLLLLCSIQGHAAGFQSSTIPGDTGAPIQVAIWYPSKAAPEKMELGPVTQEAARNGDVAGSALPLIVISHGNGGSAFSHYDTALALADAGFVAVALTHPGDNYADQSQATNLLQRSRQVSSVLDYMLEQWPARKQLDPARIGIFGFSSGGFTALVSIGAKPDMARVPIHCQAHPSDYACKLLAKHRSQPRQETTSPSAGQRNESLHDKRIRAAVIAAPALGFAFDREGSRQVDLPIQLWRAEDDKLLPQPWYAESVRQSLPKEPEYHTVAKAGHFDFVAPCGPRLAALAPAICASNEGFDRTRFHARFDEDLVRFFEQTLK